MYVQIRNSTYIYLAHTQVEPSRMVNQVRNIKGEMMLSDIL